VLARALFRGGVIGGLVAFILQAAVWNLLPWHHTLTQAFADEAAVARVLAEQAGGRRGVFQLPDTRSAVAQDESEALAQVEGLSLRLQQGPVALIALRPEGLDLRNPGFFLGTLLIQVLGALGLTLLIWPRRASPFLQRWITVLGAVVAVSLLNQLPYWNWWHFTGGWVAVQLADLLLVWAGAGLVIAWAAGPAGRRFTAPSRD
jgi:hypothetical protein